MGEFKIVCLGVMTLDYLSRLDSFPIVNTKMKTKNVETMGGGNAANVVYGLAKMMNSEELSKPHQTITIELISKIGNDAVGQVIMKEFTALKTESKNVNIELNQVMMKDGVASSFSYIIITPASNSEGYNRTIINTPMSEDFQFEEIASTLNADNVDLLFMDGRHSQVGLEYFKMKNIQLIIMECERMRLGKELKSFIGLITKSNVLFLSDNFALDYLEWLLQNTAMDEQKEWIEKALKEGYDKKLIAMHIAFSQLSKPLSKNIPNFINTTLGSKGSIIMMRFNDICHQSDLDVPNVETFKQCIPSLPISQNAIPTTSLQCTTLNGVKYLLIYCQSYNNNEKNIEDTTGAGDSFHVSLIYSLRYLLTNPERIAEPGDLEKCLKFASMASFETCTATGARHVLTSDQATKLWPVLVV